jgi:AcrR family transcriptional regulator
MTVRHTELHARQRQRRRDARERILDAARALLEEHAWSELAVETVMAEADLTRTAFYRHFEDRQSLLLALIEDMNVEFAASGGVWKDGGDEENPAETLRAGLDELLEVCVRHGRLIQALADASTVDGEVRETYAAMTEHQVQLTATRIARDVQRGRSDVSDPEAIARAVVLFSERYLLAAFGRRPFADRETVAATQAHVWIRAIYGALP